MKAVFIIICIVIIAVMIWVMSIIPDERGKPHNLPDRTRGKENRPHRNRTVRNQEPKIPQAPKREMPDWLFWTGIIAISIVVFSPIAAFIGLAFGFIPVAIGWRDWLEEFTYWKCAFDGYVMVIGIFLIGFVLCMFGQNTNNKK